MHVLNADRFTKYTYTLVNLFLHGTASTYCAKMLYLHELGVMSSVDHHTMHPLSVPQLSSSQ